MSKYKYTSIFSVQDFSPSFKSVRFPKLEIFDEIFCTNLQSPVRSRPVWSRHVGVPTNNQISK